MSGTAESSQFKKGPAMKNAMAEPVGHRVTHPRPGNAAQSAGRTPLSARGSKFAWGSEFEPTTDKDVANEVSVALADYSVGQIAQAAQCTKDAAKSWKKGHRAPRSSHLLNMAAKLPRIADYVETRTGLRASLPEAPIVNHGNVVGIIAVLQQAAMIGGETGAQAKAMLSELMKGPSA